jgi:hypothetical protein
MGIEEIRKVKEISCDFKSKICTLKLDVDEPRDLRRIGPVYSTWFEGDIFMAGHNPDGFEVKYESLANCDFNDFHGALTCKPRKED